MKFNEQQMEIINHREGNCVIFASSGSGKSTCLVSRTEELVLSGVPQSEILLITFTNASATDLKKKLKKKGLEGVACGTYHAVCARLLAISGVDISKKLQVWEVENLLARLNGNKKVDFEDVMSFISYQKNHGLTYKDKFIEKESAYSEEQLRAFFRAYEDLKKSKGVYDFDDYLLECLKLYQNGLCDKTWEYLQVDENQDNNSVQSELMKYFCPKNNITLVGDEKQSLYSFRAARPELFLNAPKTLNAKVIHLDTNYRSAKGIVDISNNFASKYFGHYEYYKDAKAHNSDSGRIEVLEVMSKDEEAQKVVNRINMELMNGVDPSEIAVLYRNHSMAASIEMELREQGIEYEIESNGSFFKQKQIEIILSVLRLAVDPNDNNAFEYLFKSRVGDFKYLRNAVLEDIRKMSNDYNISFLESAKYVPTSQQWEKMKLSQIPDLVSMIVTQHESGLRLNRIVENIIKILKLKTYIEDNAKNQDEMDARLESLETLMNFVTGESIHNFLNYAYDVSLKRKKEKKDNPNAIKLQTIHKSKGLEYSTVFLIGLHGDGKFPSAKSDLQSECSCMYVGITRAKEKLYVSGNMGSPFFEDIQEGLSNMKNYI